MKEVELLSIGDGRVAKLETFPDEVISDGHWAMALCLI